MLFLLPFLNFFSPISGIFTFLEKNWKLFACIIVAAVIAFFVWSWDARGKQLVAIGFENATLKSNISVLNEKNKLLVQANETAAAVTHEDTVRVETVTQIIERATNAPQTDNATIAPVLRRGLIDIGKLLDDATAAH